MKPLRIPKRNPSKGGYPTPFLGLWLGLAALLAAQAPATAFPTLTYQSLPASRVDIPVSGRVTGEDNLPLVGVSVVIKGTTSDFE